MTKDPQTTHVTLEDWISTLPINVQIVVRNQISAAHRMATALGKYFPNSTSYDSRHHEEMRQALALWKETQ